MSFHYYTGEEVQVGDKVRTGNQNLGVVKMVIDPCTQASRDFQCP